MVLRSGIIIPFQFRDSKKLLMIGVPEENRNLNIWDLRNVVRAAFGIYNFEFRNKKIGFNIPDELLLHYLAQRRDLTNFVIEVGQADPSDVVQDNGLVDSSSTENFTTTGSSLQMNESMHMPETPGQEYRDSFDSKQIKYTDALTNSDVRNAFTSASQSLDKECGVYEGYAEQTQSTPKLHPIGEEHAADKCEQGDCGIEQNQKPKKQPPEVDPIQRQLNAGSQIFCPRQTFELRDDNDIHLKKINYQQHQYASCAMNRFRIYDPCKENFTSMGSCNTCHCPAAQKSSLELHDNVSTSIYNAAAGGRSNASGTSSQNSQNADELPVMKMRMQHANIPPSEISHMEIEPKIDYDGTINTTGANTDADESSPPPMSIHAKPGVYLDEEHHQHQQQQQQQQELHLERLQHEYALQQHQQQQHFEAMMQENTTGNSFRQRKERMSKKQKEIYVNFMEQNPVINEHRRGDPILDQYWGKLADILNSVPQGAVKHVAEWKQTFDNWRYRVFLYARYNSKITGADALNPKSFKPFTQTDKRAYHFWIRNPDTAPPDLEKMRNVFVNLEETQQE